MRYLVFLPFLLLSSAYAQPGPEVFVIRLGLAHDQSTPVGSGAIEFTQLANQELEGSVRVELITQMQDVLPSLKNGDIQMGVVGTTELVEDLPQMVLFDLPFFFSDIGSVIDLERSYVGESLLASLERTNILGLAYWTLGISRLFSPEQITSPGDLAGTTLWTTTSTQSYNSVSKLGLSPIFFRAERLFETVPSDFALGGMEIGQIGAADLSPVVVAQAPDKYSLKHVLDVGYRPLVTIFGVSVQFWEELPYDLQTALLSIARKVQGTVDYLAVEADKYALSELVNSGYSQHSLRHEVESAFSRAAANYWELSFDSATKPVLWEAKYIRNTRAAVIPEHDWNWATNSVFFVTNRRYDATREAPAQRFSAEYGDRRWYGVFNVGLDRSTAIGADHGDSYRVEKFSVESPTAFWRALEEELEDDRKMIIVIHGVKNSLLDALLRAGILGLDLGFKGPVMVFSWPSDHRQLRYRGDGVNARRSVDHFVETVNEIVSKIPLAKLYIISHSKGGEVVVEALSELADLLETIDFGAVELVFAAPDVDAIVFKTEIKKIVEKIDRVTLYSSDNDIALRCAAMVEGGYERAGQEGEALLVLPGVETVDATALVQEEERHRYDSCVSGVGFVALGRAESDFEHAYVFNDRRVIADLAGIILKDEGADERFGLREQWKHGAKYHAIRP